MATLEVLGMGCRRCIALLQNAEEAVRQEGRNDSVTKVTKCDRILALNPWALPALAIDGKVVEGRLATPAEIRRLLAGAPSEVHSPASPQRQEARRNERANGDC